MQTIKIKKSEGTYRPDLLKDLANYLNKIDNQFDLSTWIGYKEGDIWMDDIRLEHAEKLVKGPLTHKKLKECGTTGCAMGHAPSVPSIAKAGLKLHILDSDAEEGIAVLVPEYKGATGEDAAMNLFGIPREVAGYFFMPNSYPENKRKNPKYVADRIYKFLEHPVETCNALGCYLGGN
jgi:hypothetical protein